MMTVLGAIGIWHIVCASDGQEGIEILCHYDVDVIYVDFEMPGMNGLDFIKSTRALKSAKSETPIIMLSGVGPADHLLEHGISVRADLRGGGANLQDHPQVVVRHGVENRRTLQWLSRMDRGALAMIEYALTCGGAAAYMPTGVGCVLRSEDGLEEPDLQGIFVPGTSGGKIRHPFARATEADSIGLLMYQLRPESRGKLSLRGDDPFAPPRIEANYFADPRDRAAIRGGVRVARRIFEQPAFSGISTGEVAPGPGADVDTWIGQTARTNFHPVGTCRMGPDNDLGAVVDARLRVRGVEGLRVADASIMPRLTSGNTNAPSMLIGQRCADFMLERAGAT